MTKIKVLLSETEFCSCHSECVDNDVVLLTSNIPIIFFFGADGTGKTTQTRRLVLYLERRGFKVKHVWIRGQHTLSFLLSKIIVHLICKRKISSQHNLKHFDPPFSRGLKMIWGFIEFVSVLPLIILKIELPRLLNYAIVADRCVIDTIVYIAYLMKDHNFMHHCEARILFNLIPKNAILIHFDADTGVILNRRSEEGISVDFIEFQRKTYRALAKSLRVPTFDTSERNEKDTFKAVLDQISSRLLEKWEVREGGEDLGTRQKSAFPD